MFMKPEFQDKGKTSSIRRILHIIALLQNNKDPMNWNAKTLADKLSFDPHDQDVDNSAIKHCLNSIKKDPEIELSIRKGSPKIAPIENIRKEYLAELLRLYTSIIVIDDTRNSIIERLIDKNETECMCNIANIYFASFEKRIITFSYTNNEGKRSENISFKPYHLISKGHNIYLMGKKRGENDIRQYILEKIENIRIQDSRFEDTLPSPDSYFKYSISPFMTDPVAMKIKYDRKVAQEIRQILSFIGKMEHVKIDGKKRTKLEITEYEFNDHFTAGFKIADYKHLMKLLFFYGSLVEILEPSIIRNEMKSILEESLSIYKK